MAKLGVISDCHGAQAMVKRAANALNECAAIAFLGDGVHEIKPLSALTGVPMWIVRGNCDWYSQESDKRIIEFEGVRVLMTHGHLHSVKYDITTLSFAAREAGARLALFGHTHTPAHIEHEGITYVNPGALKDGDYAIIDIDKGVISAQLRKL